MTYENYVSFKIHRSPFARPEKVMIAKKKALGQAADS